jgi:hypothetical protein
MSDTYKRLLAQVYTVNGSQTGSIVSQSAYVWSKGTRYTCSNCSVADKRAQNVPGASACTTTTFLVDRERQV